MKSGCGSYVLVAYTIAYPTYPVLLVGFLLCVSASSQPLAATPCLVCISVCMYMYVYVRICMYMYVYVCICLYMYVYVCMFPSVNVMKTDLT